MGSTTVQQPAPISYSESMRDALLAQAESQRGTGAFADIGPLIGLEREYRPQWTGLELQSLQQALQGTPGGTRTVQDTRMVERTRQVVNPEFQDAINRGELKWSNNERPPRYVWGNRSRRGDVPEQYITETYETPEVYDRTIEGEAIPGLIQQYQQDIAPAISAMDAEALRARTESEQGIIDQYGQDLANKLRDAAGNRELIESIVADATGEGDPAGLAQLVEDAGYARGQYGELSQPSGYTPGEIVAPGVTAPAIGAGADVTAPGIAGRGVAAPGIGAGRALTFDPLTGEAVAAPGVGAGQGITVDAVTGQPISAPGISAGRELTTRGLTGPKITAPAEAGYVSEGRTSLQDAMGGALLQTGEDELRRPMSGLDTQLLQAAMERAGSGLTSGEARDIQQRSRQAWTARGLAGTTPSALAETYYLTRAGDERRRANEAAAAGLAGDVEGRRMAGRQMGAGMIGQAAGQRLGAYQADVGRGTGQQQFGLQASLAGGELGLRAGEFTEGQRLAAQQGMLGDEQARELTRAQMALAAGTRGAELSQQAALANQAARLQAQGIELSDAQARALSNQQAELSARGQTAGFRQQAGLANQQYGYEAQRAMQGDELARAQLRATTGLQAGMRTAELGQQADITGAQMGMEAQRLNQANQLARDQARAQLGLQAQTTGGQFGLQAQLAREEAASTAGGMRQQYGLAYQQEAEARRRRALEGDRSFRMGVLGLQDQLAGTQYGRRVGAAGLAQSTGGDPFLSLLGRPSGVSQMAPGYAGAGQALYGGAGPRIFSPESQMQQDIAMSNQQTTLGARSAQAAATGQMWGGLFGGIGSALSGK